MPPQNSQSYPFVTRDMLAFNHGTKLELEVSLYCVGTGTINLRGMTREGPFGFSIIPTGLQYEESFIFSIPDVPIFATLQTIDSEHLQGNTWGSVFLRVNDQRYTLLASGWVSELSSPSYPLAQSSEVRSGGGTVDFITLSNPAAGSEVSQAVATYLTVRPISIQVALVTDANAANRRVHFSIERSTGLVLARWFADVDQPANTTYTYFCAPYGAIPDSVDNNVVLVPMPQGLVIKPGWELHTRTTNLQAGDNFGAPTIMTEEWITQN